MFDSRRDGPQAALGLVLALSLWSASLTMAAEGSYGPFPLRPKDAELVTQSGEFHELLTRRGLIEEEGPAAEMVRRVGASVAPRLPSDDYLEFRFFVLRNEVANAFALPDGRIYVHEGLLALLENEAQLAAVLAHECMHVEGHHALVHARSTRKKSGGMLAFSIALGGLAGEIGSLGTALADQLVTTLVIRSIIGYGRDLEVESDRRAVLRLLESGYDPREMPQTFELLAEDPEGERIEQRPMWRSHPLAVDRAISTRHMLEELSDQIAEREATLGGLQVGLADFEAVVAIPAQRSVREFIEADRPRMALWLAERNLERWPAEAIFHSQLGDAWLSLDAREAELGKESLDPKERKKAARARATTTRQERLEERLEAPTADETRARNLARAHAAYFAAFALEPEHAESMLGMGYLEESRGNELEAGRWFVRYLRASPEAVDRAIVLRRLDEITQRLRGEGEGS